MGGGGGPGGLAPVKGGRGGSQGSGKKWLGEVAEEEGFPGGRTVRVVQGVLIPRESCQQGAVCVCDLGATQST